MSSSHGFGISTGPEGPRYSPGADDNSKVCGYESSEFLNAGLLTLSPGLDTPSTLYYHCENPRHPGMGATISVIGGTAERCLTTDDNSTARTNSTVPAGRRPSEPRRSDYLNVHGVIMYTAFGVLLPVAALMAHIGKRVERSGRSLSVHVVMAPSAVLLGLVGVALAAIGIEQDGDQHMHSAHAYIGSVVLILAVVAQPLAMLSGLRQTHRRQGAAIVVAGLANVLQGISLLRLSVALQLAQVVFMGLVVVVYVLYQPSSWEVQKPVVASARVRARVSKASHPSGSYIESLLPAAQSMPRGQSCAVGQSVCGVELGCELPAAQAPPKPQVAAKTEETADGNGVSDAHMHKLSSLQAEVRAHIARLPEDPEETSVRMESIVSAALTDDLRQQRSGEVQAGRKGTLKQAELQTLLKFIVAKNRLTVSEEDIGTLSRALLVVGDADASGELDFRELEGLLALRGLKLENDGTLARLPATKVPGGSGDAQPRRASQREEEERMMPAFTEEDRKAEAHRTPLRQLARRVEDSLPKVFWTGLWVVANILAFVFHFGGHACWFDKSEDCVPYAPAVRVAKGAGMALNLNCALIVVPMCRRFLTFLRSFPAVRKAVPLDSSYDFHMLLGWSIAGLTVIHVVAHYVNYASLPNPEIMVTSSAGATGHALLLILTLICVTALARFRRAKHFHIFIFTHHLFILFFALLFVHGNDFVGPNFWKFASWPLALYVCERAVRMSNTDHRHGLRVLRCEKLKGNVTLLQFEKPPNFRYLPGQYCFVAIPALAHNSCGGTLEFHPFTISSAPHEPFVSLHIRAAGDWTEALHKLASPAQANGIAVEGPVKVVLLDGPYGSASEEVFDYDVAVMVGAGIGVTPFASILKDVRHKLDALNSLDIDLERLQQIFEAVMGSAAQRAAGSGASRQRSSLNLQKLYFYWTTREQGAFEWFGDLLTKLHSEGGVQRTASDTGKHPWELEICTFITGMKAFEKGPTDLGSLFLQLALDLVLETTGVALLTGHNRGTRFERPDWDDIFDEIAQSHKGRSVGVFFCGPERLGAVLREKCRVMNVRHAGVAGAAHFSFRTEVF